MVVAVGVVGVGVPGVRVGVPGVIGVCVPGVRVGVAGVPGVRVGVAGVVVVVVGPSHGQRTSHAVVAVTTQLLFQVVVQQERLLVQTQVSQRKSSQPGP